MKSSKLLSIIVLLNCATQSYIMSGHGFNRLFSRAKNIILSLTAITIVSDSNTASNDNTVSSNIFSRKKMIRDDRNEKVEGYWAINLVGHSLDEGYWARKLVGHSLARFIFFISSFWYRLGGYHGKYPWPEANSQPWPGQVTFSAKLKKIENILKKSPESFVGCFGMSPSRFELNKNVGCREFQYVDLETNEVIIWPEAFRPYYVDKFNVKPSEEFYEFVMNYPLTCKDSVSS